MSAEDHAVQMSQAAAAIKDQTGLEVLIVLYDIADGQAQLTSTMPGDSTSALLAALANRTSTAPSEPRRRL